MIKGRRPSCTLTLLLLVSVDDVEESSPRVCRRQVLHRVVRPQRHRLLIALVHEGEFALVCEVVRGVGRDYLCTRNRAHTLVFVPGSLHEDCGGLTWEHDVCEDTSDPSEGLVDLGAASGPRLCLEIHAEDAVIFG
jgi:hypothetical protein